MQYVFPPSPPKDACLNRRRLEIAQQHCFHQVQTVNCGSGRSCLEAYCGTYTVHCRHDTATAPSSPHQPHCYAPSTCSVCFYATAVRSSSQFKAHDHMRRAAVWSSPRLDRSSLGDRLLSSFLLLCNLWSGLINSSHHFPFPFFFPAEFMHMSAHTSDLATAEAVSGVQNQTIGSALVKSSVKHALSFFFDKLPNMFFVS